MAHTLSALVLATSLVLFSDVVHAFSFSIANTSPSKCDELEITWSGGESPWSLTIIPAYDYPQTVSIPSSSYDSTTDLGSYNWTVNYPSGTSFVAMMSDGTGTGTGGVTPLYNVSGTSSSSCTLRSENTDFLFYLNETEITQCQPVEIYWDSTAVSPISILGAIPGGQVFQLVSSSDDTTSLAWSTNVKADTQLIFAAFDSGTYEQGGSSKLLTVQDSSNNACIDSSSPSSTSSGSQSTATGTSGTETKTNAGGVVTVTAITTETASAAAGDDGSSGLSTAAIVGIVVSAVLVAAAAQVALVWFCCRRQIRALIYHRREMRGQEVKPGGAVDLGLATRNSYVSAPDYEHSPTAEYSPNIRGSHYAASHAGGTGAPPSHSQEDFEAEASISPFWDGAAAMPNRTNSTYSMSASNRPPTLGYLGFDSDTNFLQPPRALGSDRPRNDSFSSFTLSIPETIGESSPSPNSPINVSPFFTQATGLSSAPGTSRAMSKAQMVASLNAHDPDGPRRNDFGPRQPSHEAPAGGFRRHEDAGRVDETAVDDEPSVEDLPPMYKPEWEADSQRGE